ncbi:MAG: HAD family phosphatase [Clostridia bacterium]|nr:HAD family phosphatase [Clostridia bacterium]
MKKLEHFIFDFDGTLVDSMPTFAHAVLTILDNYGAKYPSDIIKTVTPLGIVDTANYCIATFNLPLSTEVFITDMMRLATDAYMYEIPLKESVLRTLKELKSRGASLNILTASPHETLDPCLERLGVLPLFDNVWSCNDFNTNKSNPEIYKMAAKKLGTTAENTVFLDDNIEACRSAKRGGCKVVGVYDSSSDDFAADMKRELDGYIVRLIEILDISL